MSKIGNQEKLVIGSALVLLGLSGLLASDIVSTSGFPKGFLNQITESDIVKARLSSRWKWEVWDIVPGHHVFRIHLFNVTNPEDVERGLKPILSEVGPYIYTEQRIKFNVSVNMDLSVNYQRNFTYTFDPTNSNGTEDDLVNVLNVPFIIFSTIVSRRGNPGNEAVKKLVHEGGETLIKRRVKVGDVLFNGIDVSRYKPYISLLTDTQDSLLYDEFNSGSYGVLKMKRGAHEGTFTVQSGLKDPTNIGKILKWDNEPSLSFWNGPTCNMINGSDGSLFPPYVDNDSKLEVFDIDLCRSMDFLFKKSTNFHTVPAAIFTLDKNLLADPRNYTSNACFCKNPGPRYDNCLRSGVLDVSSCRDGAPYVMSYPHFLDASPEYGQAVAGLQPNEKIHSTNMDIQPRLGVVIRFNRRLQWNIKLQPLPGIEQFANVRPLLFPVLWNDDNFKLDDDKVDLLVSEIANIEASGLACDLRVSFQVFIFGGFLVYFTNRSG